jgi:hypothetical protein
MRIPILLLAGLLALGCTRREAPPPADAAAPPAAAMPESRATVPLEVRYFVSESNGTVAPQYARSSALTVDLRVRADGVSAHYTRRTFVAGRPSEENGRVELGDGWTDRVERLAAGTTLEPIPDRPATVGGGSTTVRLTLAFADGRRREGRPDNVDAWAALVREVLSRAGAADGTGAEPR